MIYDPLLATVKYLGPHTTDGPVTATMLKKMDAGVLDSNGLLVLPAGDSALVTLTVADVGLTGVASDPEHGTLAFAARTVGKLIEKLPLDKLSELDGLVGKAVACVHGALELADKQDFAIDKAIETAEACVDMSEEISKRWEERAAKAAPKATALRTRFSTAAREGEPAANGIKRLVTGVVGVLAHR